MEITVSGKFLNVDQISALLVEGENNADTIQIRLPAKHGALELGALSYSLDGYTNKNSRVGDALPRRTVDGAVLLTWKVTEKWAAVSGTMELELVGADGAGNVKIKWMSTRPITIRQTLGTGPLPVPDIMQQYLSMAQDLTLQAAASADRAEAAAAKSGAMLEEAKRYTNQQVDLALTERIYEVPYYDPTDGNKRNLQDVLDRMYSQRIGAYTWNELEEKNLTWAEFEALGLTCNDITKGGW